MTGATGPTGATKLKWGGRSSGSYGATGPTGAAGAAGADGDTFNYTPSNYRIPFGAANGGLKTLSTSRLLKGCRLASSVSNSLEQE